MSAVNPGHFVRDVDGPGGQVRVAEFLHEADLTHDYALIQGDVVERGYAETISAAEQWMAGVS